MIKRKWFRLALGTILGGFAGLSLTSSILPMAIATIGAADSFFVRWRLSDYAAHIALLWAVGGWAVAKAGHPKAGAVILGLVGLISGVLLSILALGTEMPLLVTAGVVGAGYGLIGGLLLGTILRSDAPPPHASENR